MSIPNFFTIPPTLSLSSIRTECVVTFEAFVSTIVTRIRNECSKNHSLFWELAIVAALSCYVYAVLSILQNRLQAINQEDETESAEVVQTTTTTQGTNTARRRNVPNSSKESSSSSDPQLRRQDEAEMTRLEAEEAERQRQDPTHLQRLRPLRSALQTLFQVPVPTAAAAQAQPRIALEKKIRLEEINEEEDETEEENQPRVVPTIPSNTDGNSCEESISSETEDDHLQRPLRWRSLSNLLQVPEMKKKKTE